MSGEIRGFSIPFRIDPSTGGIAQQLGDEKLKENLVHILLTRVGERVMRRAYGGGVHDMLHDPNNDALQALAHHQIGRAIAQWEPRVLLQGLDVTQQNGELFIRIHYVVRRTRQAESVSLPLGVI
jgi:phage baseplate assembly protein W